MNVVQIGTCKANDDLPQYVRENPVSKIVLVEPMEVHNDDIRNSYEGTPYTIENCAIVTNDLKEMSFFYHKNDGPKFEVASTSKQHILKHGYADDENLIELNVPCMTINRLFDKHEMKKIDYLFIDSEGLDEAIIKSIDFDKYEIDQIYFEGLHINVHSTVEYLFNRGYGTEIGVGSNGWDCLATKILKNYA
jgi:FkbM family methyltransferase